MYASQIPLRWLALLVVVLVSGCTSQGAASGPADATAPGEDATAQGEDATAQDAGKVPPPTGTFPCTAPLSSVCDVDAAVNDFGEGGCPPEFISALPGPWCATTDRVGTILGPCGGYDVFPVYSGTDVAYLFMYPTDGGALAAIINAPNLNPTACIGGSPNFALPGSCLGNGADMLVPFNGPDNRPGCSAYDAGQDAALDAGDGGG